jgi:general secretion pathway protein G
MEGVTIVQPGQTTPRKSPTGRATIECIRRRRLEQHRDEGFTLIELMMVIVVLGILAMVVVFASQNLTASTARSACHADYKTTETAAETYKGQEGRYPTQVSDLTGKDAITGNGPWLKEAPNGGSHYTITIDQASERVQVGAGTATPTDGSGQCAGVT